MKTALIVGASPKVDRYSNMAVRMLNDSGWSVLPFNPAYEEIEGVKCYKEFADVEGIDVDLLSVYLRPAVFKKYIEEIAGLNPGKIIFNPGTEDSEIINFFIEKEIEVQTACTLVLSRAGQL